MTSLDVPGDRPAVVDASSGALLTHGEVRERADALLAPVRSRPGLTLVLCGNNLFSLLVLAGALRGGRPVALLDPRTTAERLQGLVETYRPTWVAGPPDTASRLTELGIAVEQDEPADGGSLVRLAVTEPPTLHPDLAVLLSTSGTTGSRKLVRLSAANLRANADAIAAALELTPAERPVTTQPLHSAFGLSVLTSHWAAGAPVVLTDQSVLQPTFWETVERHGCTSLAGVPFVFQLLERIGFREKDVPSLTALQQAGGALDPELIRAYDAHMRARGGRLHVMYGQTEATARITCVPPDRLADKIGSVGVAVPGGTVEIDDTGQVVHRGPSVMLGHASDASDLARGDELGGVLRTGDLGRLDDDGYLWLAGRSTRAAKLFGERLDVDELERELSRLGPAAVLGGTDVVWAFRAYDTQTSIEDDAYRTAKRHGIHPRAFHLRRVERIPTLPSGEIDYAEVSRWTE